MDQVNCIPSKVSFIVFVNKFSVFVLIKNVFTNQRTKKCIFFHLWYQYKYWEINPNSIILLYFLAFFVFLIFNLSTMKNTQKGTIDMKELRAAMKAMGYDASKDELKKVRFDLDKEIGEEVNFEEFLSIMTGRMSRHDTREEIDNIFKLFDEDNTGFITFRNLKRICQELGEDIPDSELQDMIEEADKDGDGKVSSDDFWKIMKKRSGDPLDQISSDEDDDAL